MVEHKTKNIAAVLLAVAAAFLLLGISYILFPDQTPQHQTLSPPIFIQEQLSDQIFWVIQWIGLAVFIAITVFGVTILTSRIRRKKTLNYT